MEKNKIAILTVVCIILVSVLVINSSSNGKKVGKAESQIVALSAVVANKDAEVKKLSGMLKAKDQEVATLNKEIERVKTELSNTVVRLQASPNAQK